MKNLKCIIVDDEPIARKGIEKLVSQIDQLQLMGTFNNAESASLFLNANPVDLVFLDIQMPGITGLEFARYLPKSTLVIFTTAYAEYALDSYEIEAIDYLVKPIQATRFNKAVEKAVGYHSLLMGEEKEKIENIAAGHMFVKSDRRYIKVNFHDILFIEGLKDYVIIQLADQKIITHMNLKNMHELLPEKQFLRVNRSYIVNTEKIDSFDNNDIFIRSYEIGIGNFYRDSFFQEFVARNMGKK